MSGRAGPDPLPGRDQLPGPDQLSGPDATAVHAQLGRPARGARGVAHRCGCGLPDVVETAPRLPDGTPFPTTYYLTCPRATSAVSTLEAEGLMRDMTARLAEDEDLAARYRAAHEDYLARRAALGSVPEVEGISAGGMPVRVKCLHVLVAHALAAGPGTNPLGDEALALLPRWGGRGPCVCPADDTPADDTPADDTPAEDARPGDRRTEGTGPVRL